MIHVGDCLDVMRTMPDASVDSVVTDPPAGIAFMGKAWDKDKGGRRQWIAWLKECMAEALRLLKPGHYAFVWALPRTSHWTATALEDAGFKVRDIVTHVQGQGFPKSKALLKPSAEHWILCRKPGPLRHLRIEECRVTGTPRATGTKQPHTESGVHGILGADRRTDRQQRYDNNLPAGRWPANFVMSHGEGCRGVGTKRVRNPSGSISDAGPRSNTVYGTDSRPRADWPAYGDPDGTEEVAAWECAPGCPVAMLDAQSGVSKSSGGNLKRRTATAGIGAGSWTTGGGANVGGLGDTGTASRFFHAFDPDSFVYQAKASRSDRGAGNDHPTVKSVALMRHLVRLITPPAGLVLDPFAGSGSTGVACLHESLRFIGIEREEGYAAIARARMETVERLP